MKRFLALSFLVISLGCVTPAPKPTVADPNSICQAASSYVEEVAKKLKEKDLITTQLLHCTETPFGDAYFIFALNKHHEVTKELIAIVHVGILLKKIDGEWTIVAEGPVFKSNSNLAVPPHKS